MIAALGLYHAVLLVGLLAMLTDGWGWIAFITYSVIMPFGALGLWLYSGRNLRDSSLSPYPGLLRDMLNGAGLALLIPISIFGIMITISWVDPGTGQRTATALITGIMVPQMFVAIAEEWAFRGVTQPLICAHVGSSRGRTITALLFGFFHLPNILYNTIPYTLIPITIGTLTVMGWVFGTAYQRTGQHLGLPIALHFGWNVASYGIADAFNSHYNGPQWLIGVPAWFPESGLLGAAGLLILYIIITASVLGPGRK